MKMFLCTDSISLVPCQKFCLTFTVNGKKIFGARMCAKLVFPSFSLFISFILYILRHLPSFFCKFSITFWSPLALTEKVYCISDIQAQTWTTLIPNTVGRALGEMLRNTRIKTFSNPFFSNTKCNWILCKDQIFINDVKFFRICALRKRNGIVFVVFSEVMNIKNRALSRILISY